MIQIITTIITSVCTLVGVVIATVATSRKSAADVQTRLAVLDEKVGNLGAEVREHNAYGRQIPVLQERIDQLEHRLEKLEKGA